MKEGQARDRAAPGIRDVLWRSSLRTSVVPFIAFAALALLAFVAVILHLFDDSIQYAEREALYPLEHIATREAVMVRQKLEAIDHLTRVLRDEVERAVTGTRTPSSRELASYRFLPDGRMVTARDYGGSALNYSGRVPVGAMKMTRAYAMAAIDGTLRSIVDSHEAVAQAYVNTHDSLTRIYPFLDSENVFDANMDVTEYPFYYLADEKHNPERQVVWTDAYDDPAGQGWVVSSVAPVYVRGRLEAVAGIDLTLSDVVTRILALDLPWPESYGALFAPDGTVIALPPRASADWSFAEGRVAGPPPGLARRFRETTGACHRCFRPDRLVGWARVEKTGWILVIAAPRDAVLAPARRYRDRAFEKLAWIAFAFFAVTCGFVLFQVRVARVTARIASAPLAQIDAMVAAIGRGAHRQPVPPMPHAELQRTAENIVAMGEEMAEKVEALEASQARLEQARKDAEAASRAKTEFLASMSHELRTPLNGVLGMAQLLRSTALSPEQERFVKVISDSSTGLLDIIGEILDFSKVEAGHFELSPRPTPLAELLEQITAPFAYRASMEGLSFAVEGGPFANVEVDVDAVKLRQTLVNLLGNALKFTEEGGVRLRVRRSDLREGWARWSFAVCDTGVGILEEARALIFEPFEQADQTSTRRFGGTGLGLAICRRFMDMMGGTLSVESELGVGSTFELRLELPTRTVTRAPAPPEEAAPLPEGRSVLVVDDNPINREILSEMLAIEGCRVELAENGLEALEKIRKQAFDLALVDIQMPIMDGLTLARALRADPPRGEPLYLVALTASASAEDREQCFAAGMDAFVSKPVDFDVLRRAMRGPQ